MIRSDSLSRAGLAVLLIFTVSIGATFNGIVVARFKLITLAVMALVVGGWLLVRWRRGWEWHPTALDGVFALWALAFALSLLENGEVWRRTAIALWYMGVYVGVWYGLHDALANGLIRREALVDALLITGFVVMIFGYLQVWGWLVARLPAMLAGIVPLDLPRPGSVLWISNSLGTFLVVLIPFAASRAVSARIQLNRAVPGVYLALAVMLTFLTYSRGAWLGLAAAALVWGCLVLAQHNMLSRRRLGEWLGALGRQTRFAIVALSVSLSVAALVMLAFFVYSLTEPGRSLELRTLLYKPALELFGEKPLTGHGLFTFGREYMRLVSIPPNYAHSHAHNAVLHIAAELGIVGLVALFVTLIVIYRAMRRNWASASQRERGILVPAAAAVAGFAVHHLLDVTAMMPAIALTGLLVLALATAPIQPAIITSRARRSGQTATLFVLWAVLFVTGLWSSALYIQYFDVLQEAVIARNYRQAAERLQSIIDADPYLALYRVEQAYLFGMAASEGDSEAAQTAIAAYRRFLELEPEHAISWVNLAALYWQVGARQEAIDAMRRAVELAPETWQFAFSLGTYAEAADESETARAAYEAVLDASPCAQTLPEWDDSPLRLAVLKAHPVTCIYAAAPPVERYVTEALDALERGDREYAVAALGNAQTASSKTPVEQAWVHVGQSRLAEFDGDSEAAERELQAARDFLEPGLLVADVLSASSVGSAQFLRTMIPRQFLLQVFFPTTSPELARLLHGS